MELELNYAKTMSKLSAKLTKVAQKGVGSIQNAWLVIGKEMEVDGQAHRCVANSLEEDIVKPLKNLQETHCRIKKTVEYNVNKTSELRARSAHEHRKRKTVYLNCTGLFRKKLPSIYSEPRLTANEIAL